MTAAQDPSVATFVALDGGGVAAPASSTAPAVERRRLLVRPTTTTTAAGADHHRRSASTIPASPSPNKPGMLITGGNDQVIPADRLQPFYDQMATPKRMVVIDGAGHNSVTDICLIGAGPGRTASPSPAKVGIQVPDQRGARCSTTAATPPRTTPRSSRCGRCPATSSWPSCADVFGIDPEPVGLGPGIAEAFPPLQITYDSHELIAARGPASAPIEGGACPRAGSATRRRPAPLSSPRPGMVA